MDEDTVEQGTDRVATVTLAQTTEYLEQSQARWSGLMDKLRDA